MVENRPAVRPGRGFWTATAVLVVLSLFAIWFWVTAPLSWMMPAVGAQPGQDIDVLVRFMASTASTLAILVFGYILYFVFAFRAKASDPPDAIGVQVHDNHTLELWWTIIPTLLLVILSIWSVQVWYRIQVAQPSNGLVVESIGHQWYYTFRYPQVHGEITDEMHLPVGTPVVLNVTSTDVIHSFWVPSFRLKADMIPGLINTIRFTPTVPGRYQIICTEFCGTQHGVMNKQIVVVEDRAAFDKWYSGWQTKNAHASDEIPKASTGTINLAGADAAAGKTLFSTKCAACHAIAPFEQKIVGPGLKGVLHDPKHPKLVDGDDATPANVAKILQQGFNGPMGVMPNATANALSDKDIANLVAFLDSLK